MAALILLRLLWLSFTLPFKTGFMGATLNEQLGVVAAPSVNTTMTIAQLAQAPHLNTCTAHKSFLKVGVFKTEQSL